MGIQIKKDKARTGFYIIKKKEKEKEKEKLLKFSNLCIPNNKLTVGYDCSVDEDPDVTDNVIPEDPNTAMPLGTVAVIRDLYKQKREAGKSIDLLYKERQAIINNLSKATPKIP